MGSIAKLLLEIPDDACGKAFRKLMKECNYGEAETLNCWEWFRDGWEECERARKGARTLKEKCGKMGCTKDAVDEVWGSLRYVACSEHLAEIKVLVDNE